jgi:hypothetical protein
MVAIFGLGNVKSGFKDRVFFCFLFFFGSIL